VEVISTLQSKFAYWIYRQRHQDGRAECTGRFELSGAIIVFPNSASIPTRPPRSAPAPPPRPPAPARLPPGNPAGRFDDVQLRRRPFEAASAYAGEGERPVGGAKNWCCKIGNLECKYILIQKLDKGLPWCWNRPKLPVRCQVEQRTAELLHLYRKKLPHLHLM